MEHHNQIAKKSVKGIFLKVAKGQNKGITYRGTKIIIAEDFRSEI